MSKLEHIENIADRVDKMACASCGEVIDVSSLQPFSVLECPKCHTKQTVPAVLGQFLLVQVLGSGGMGAVFRAMDQALGRFVAIKVMKKALGADQELVESFLREARTAAALNHRNIVQIYSCGQEKGQPYIVMELVSGGRMDQLMEGGKIIDEVRALEIGLDVDEGLRAANEIGLVHGDIKPANVLFDKAGVAKIVDFGLAQFVNAQQQSGGIWGTPYYISPERVRGGKADHRSDIYSLGATLYHAMTGHPPFEGKTASDVVVARLKGPAPDIRTLNPSLQPKTAAVIARMLEADPMVRYPTSASLLADMRDALAAARAAKGGSVTVKDKSSSKMILVGAAIALLVLGGLAFWMISDKESPPAPVVTPARPIATPIAAPQPGTATPGAVTAGTVQFFDETTEPRVIEAIQALTTEQRMVMRDKLEAVLADVPKNSARAMWVRVLQSIPCWIEGREDEAKDYCSGVARLPVSQRAGHPIYMPQVMAQYLLGELNEAQVKNLREGWPYWYEDISFFCGALERINRGDANRAIFLLESYIKSRGDAPAWAYAFRPFAQQALDQLKGLRDLRRKTNRMISAGQLDEARAQLESYQASLLPVLRKMVDSDIAKTRTQEAPLGGVAVTKPPSAVAPEPARDDQAAYRAKVQQDLDKIDEVLTANVPLVVNQKEYRKASQALARLAGGLQTAEGRAMLQIAREHCDRMEALKTFLTDSFNAEPFRQSEGTDLGGDAVGASSLGVKVSLGGRGMIVKPWEQIGVRTILKTASHYLSDTRRSDKERADLMLSLAVFCYYNGGLDVAANYAGQAAKLDPGLLVAARKLMPDVIPD